jgi:AcrR family transcriptional regulator
MAKSAAAAPENKGRAGYHHGDLRAALIAEAREALRTTSPEEIELKALALRLGVSQPAPYRHFNGRDALLAAVAEDGFERYSAVLAAVLETGPTATTLERLCTAYVSFGLSNFGVYRLMFSRRYLELSGPSVRTAQAADASFQVTVDIFAERVGTARAMTLAAALWAALHGIVTLSAEGIISGPVGDEVNTADMIAELVAGFTRR